MAVPPMPVKWTDLISDENIAAHDGGIVAEKKAGIVPINSFADGAGVKFCDNGNRPL
jgi:hypothetical protein